jgi:circadian clock protein KaiC
MRMDHDQWAQTGIAGLDDVLGGGLPRDRIYLVQGDPGVGKTTVGLQFLLAGVARGEAVLYITLSEGKDEIQAVAKSHGWSLEGVPLFEQSALDQTASLEQEYTLFQPSDIELQETTRSLLARFEQVKPTRVVVDSLSEIRLLSQSSLRYRRQILALKQHFSGRKCTVLLLDDRTSEAGDLQLQSISHGVLSMEQVPPLYGEDRRKLRVVKLRGQKFHGGYHEYVIRTGGLEVFPRLIAVGHRREARADPLSSGVAQLDSLLGGGLDRGTSTLILGPAGSGKSSIATQYLMAAARRGERAALFSFDESLETLLARSRGLGLDVEGQVKSGRILLEQIDTADIGPGEFSHEVRRRIEADGVKVVVIDSLNGYLNTMPTERLLPVQMHELLAYCGQKGVVTVLVMAQHGLIGPMQTPVDLSYLSDTVVVLRYFESTGRIRRALSVMKKRSGAHEDTIREFTLGREGMRIGEALTDFTGVLSGVPQFAGKPEKLFGE